MSTLKELAEKSILKWSRVRYNISEGHDVYDIMDQALVRCAYCEDCGAEFMGDDACVTRCRVDRRLCGSSVNFSNLWTKFEDTFENIGYKYPSEDQKKELIGYIDKAIAILKQVV